MSATDDRVGAEVGGGVDMELLGLVSRYEATKHPESRDMILSSICQHSSLHQPQALINYLDPPSSDAVLESDDSDD
ncbi:unnamed protein product [Linum trigynum]|uniref:Uncharacterized protein n=1 Tax=Linum trigynum TaxID=586398 RepID=A0AAV2FBM7_9ROSI